MLSLKTVVSGGQTGSDQAGWRAAKLVGLETSGWMPKGFMTEDGPRPEFAELYGAKEHKAATYPPRTRLNILDSDATICLSAKDGPGSRLTWDLCNRFGKPFRYITVQARTGVGLRLSPTGIPAREVAEWIAESGFRTLNVAGNRESGAPGIGEWAERYMLEVFRILKEGDLS